jgi:transcriptional regulator with XRE-family HTH domain
MRQLKRLSMRHPDEQRPTTGVPARLRAARAHADLTIEEMAARLGVSATTLGRWETGARASWTDTELEMAAVVAGWPRNIMINGFDSGES